MNRFRPRLTYANVVATIALFVALGGAGYAAIELPAGSVTSREIAPDAVRGSELAPAAVQPSDVSQSLATGLQQAINPFVPPRGSDACAVFAPSPGACVNVSTPTVTLGLLASKSSKVKCPSNLGWGPSQGTPQFVIDTASPHYSGMSASLPGVAAIGSVVMTNWSRSRFTFQATVACIPG